MALVSHGRSGVSGAKGGMGENLCRPFLFCSFLCQGNIVPGSCDYL